MELKQYLTETEKQYNLRLKTIVPLDDGLMDRIETCVARYNPISVSRPKKTILQRTPLDFPNVTCAEVYIVDMTFGLPTAPHVLRADIRKLLDAPENYVFVRNRNEPGEVESERINALADIALEAERRGLKPAATLLDREYSEADPENPGLYGMDYNTALINYLGSIEQERHVKEDSVQNAPFRWLPLADREKAANFNDDVPDAPFATYKPKTTPDISQHMLGNIDRTKGEVRRSYMDKDGKLVVLTRKLGGE